MLHGGIRADGRPFALAMVLALARSNDSHRRPRRDLQDLSRRSMVMSEKRTIDNVGHDAPLALGRIRRNDAFQQGRVHQQQLSRGLRQVVLNVVIGRNADPRLRRLDRWCIHHLGHGHDGLIHANGHGRELQQLMLFVTLVQRLIRWSHVGA